MAMPLDASVMGGPPDASDPLDTSDPLDSSDQPTPTDPPAPGVTALPDIPPVVAPPPFPPDPAVCWAPESFLMGRSVMSWVSQPARSTPRSGAIMILCIVRLRSGWDGCCGPKCRHGVF